MIKTLLIACLLFQASILLGQKKVKVEPLIIQGQLTNCQEKWLIIYFKDIRGTLSDTIFLDNSGKFYLKTYKVKGPEIANIRHNDTQINDLFVAPGYNLTMNGNAEYPQALSRTISISGPGAENNYYKSKLLTAHAGEKITKPYYEMDMKDLVDYAHRNRKLDDSVAHVVFDKILSKDQYNINLPSNRDKNTAYFKNMVLLDNKFKELNSLVGHANDPLHINKYSYEQMVAVVRNNFDHTILDDLYKDDYLVSEEYKSFIRSTYLSYLIKLDRLRDPALNDSKYYSLEKINKVYKGKVREYALYYTITFAIDPIKSLDEFNNYKQIVKPYFESITNSSYKKDISEKIGQKVTELLNTTTGKPAPQFTLENNKGATYSLADFKGKVVYLDLWASWCGPCRAETPGLNNLYNKYKNDSRVVIISIAVSDGIKEWKKALNQDKPDWLQLLDKEGVVNKAYVAVSIPQFIIIDKKGNIVDFDAPRPSSGKVEALLLSEMVK